MATCRACGKKGVRKTALAVVIGDGANKGGRVCQGCERGGMLVVAAQGEAPTLTARATRAHDAREVLNPIIRQVQVMIFAAQRALKLEGDNERGVLDGKVEGLEDVMHLLKEARDR